MSRRAFINSLLLATLVPLLSASLSAETDPDAPAVSGYVTSADNSGAFAVNGYGIHVRAGTTFVRFADSGLTILSPSFPGTPYLGERIDVFGTEGKKHTIDAERVVLKARVSQVSGKAIIDLVLPPSNASIAGCRVVRADGYLLCLTKETKLSFLPPLASVDELGTNLWIEYSGTQEKTGTVLVKEAKLSKNAVSASEDRLREKNEYDPSQIDDGDRQDPLVKLVVGRDPKRIPAYDDKAMQKRVDEIGQKLIPAYQRSLPASDETKIEFRFQLIDDPGSFSGITLPSGVILVQRRAVERLTNDSQLAAILADHIAEVMEKGEFRLLPVRHKVLGARVVGVGAAVLVPGAATATSIVSGAVEARVVKAQLRQRSRVSLFLMEDAGYDITQAPLAWWLMASKKPKPIEKIDLPEESKSLYEALGTTFHPQA